MPSVFALDPKKNSPGIFLKTSGSPKGPSPCFCQASHQKGQPHHPRVLLKAFMVAMLRGQGQVDQDQEQNKNKRHTEPIRDCHSRCKPIEVAWVMDVRLVSAHFDIVPETATHLNLCRCYCQPGLMLRDLASGINLVDL